MVEIHPLLRQRRSSRLYDPDRGVGPELIETLLEAARWAPSGGNRQPWRYIVFDERVPGARDIACSCLNDGNRAWATAAPVLIAGISRDRRDDGRPNAKAHHDLGMANMSLMLQAIALGLNCRPMGGFDAARFRELFHLPEDHTPIVIIAVGFPGQEGGVTEELRLKEHSPRVRSPIADLAYLGEWGRPVV